MLALAVAEAGTSVPPETGARLREVGAGSLHWFGLHVYDARLEAAGDRFDPSRPFALTLRYARDVKGDRIAQTSIDEIRRLGFGAAADHQRWLEAMRRVLPDVKRGDELTGTSVPGRGAEFFLNGRPLGGVDDPEFARAFYAIWLDPRTRARDLRAQLLGEAPCNSPSAPADRGGATSARC